jgi:hypothetical protein
MLTPAMEPAAETADPTERILALEAKLVAHGILLQTVGRLLSEQSLSELRSVAQGIDDEGMSEANPDPQMRRVATELFQILGMLG